ncbi:MAG: EamA/RhaT family transporter [Methylocystaceae bacterium]|nr:MAG: EamA/RhaT family transporter [Methylocystaceae bacterium]
MGLVMLRIAISVLVLIFSAIWSSAFIAAKVAVRDYDPFTVLAARFAIAALVLGALVGVARGEASRDTVETGILLGLLNNCAYLGLTFYALNYISPVLVVVIVSCAPFLTILISRFFASDTMSVRQTAGVALGFLGVLVVTGIDLGAISNLEGVALALSGTASFSLATVLFRARAQHYAINQLNLWQSVTGAVVLTPAACLFGRPLIAPTIESATAILYLAIVVTIGGMGLWLLLIRLTGAAKASSYHLLNPFFGVLLSAVVLKTPLRILDFAGAAIVASGLALVISSPMKKE